VACLARSRCTCSPRSCTLRSSSAPSAPTPESSPAPTLRTHLTGEASTGGPSRAPTACRLAPPHPRAARGSSAFGGYALPWEDQRSVGPARQAGRRAQLLRDMHARQAPALKSPARVARRGSHRTARAARCLVSPRVVSARAAERARRGRSTASSRGATGASRGLTTTAISSTTASVRATTASSLASWPPRSPTPPPPSPSYSRPGATPPPAGALRPPPASRAPRRAAPHLIRRRRA